MLFSGDACVHRRRAPVPAFSRGDGPVRLPAGGPQAGTDSGDSTSEPTHLSGAGRASSASFQNATSLQQPQQQPPLPAHQPSHQQQPQLQPPPPPLLLPLPPLPGLPGGTGLPPLPRFAGDRGGSDGAGPQPRLRLHRLGSNTRAEPTLGMAEPSGFPGLDPSSQQHCLRQPHGFPGGLLAAAGGGLYGQLQPPSYDQAGDGGGGDLLRAPSLRLDPGWGEQRGPGDEDGEMPRQGGGGGGGGRTVHLDLIEALRSRRAEAQSQGREPHREREGALLGRQGGEWGERVRGASG
jgi:hypothetical protein